MTCDQHLVSFSGSLVTDNYVDCAITTVSGHLQNEIGSSPGVWEVLAVEELSSDASTITVSDIPARDFLRVYIDTQRDKSANFVYYLRMNGDTGNNYTEAGAGFKDKIQIISESGSTNPNPTHLKSTIDITNVADEIKPLVGQAFHQFKANWGTNTYTAFRGAWNNTSDSISSITLLTSVADDFLAGSRIVVTGMNFA